MAETPRLDLPYLAASQFQKEVYHNLSLDRLDLLCQCAVLDRNLTTPPGTVALGDAYIVAAPGAGAWAGHANHLALWVSGQWELIAPLPGFQCWVLDEAVLVYWSGTAWTIITAGGGGATSFLGLTDTPDSYSGQAGKVVQVNSGGTALEFGTAGGGGGAPTDATYIVSSANATLSAERVLTDSVDVTWNLATAGQVQAIIPADAIEFAQIQNVLSGTLVGRSTIGTGDIESIAVGTGLDLSGGTLSATGGGGGGYSDEQAQDAVGAILTDSGTVDFTYDDTTPTITAIVKDASLSEAKLALTDLTTANATTGQHGLLPKLSGSATQYLDGSGAWSTPAGGGGGGTPTLGATITRAAAQTITANTLTVVSFDTEVRDENAYWSSGQPTRVVLSATGWYTVTVGITWTCSSSVNGFQDVNLRLNGTTYVLVDRRYVYSTTVFQQVVSGLVYLTAGDYLEVALYQNNGGTTTITGSVNIAAYGQGLAASSFLALTDTPDAYTGEAGKVVRVNAGATATEFGPVLGTMATQNATAVAITGGTATLASLITTAQVSVGTNLGVTTTGFFGGNVGIGLAPLAFADLAILHKRAAGDYALVIRPDADAGNPGVVFNNVAAAIVGSISTTATTTAFNTSSDQRLKHAVEPLTGALETVLALHPVAFRWNADNSAGHGFLAHEVQVVVPTAVSGDAEAVDDAGAIIPLQLDMSKLIPWLVAGLQELTARVTALEAAASTT